MKCGILPLLLIAILGLPHLAIGNQDPVAVHSPGAAGGESAASKKELFERIKALQEKLPLELKRKLIVISMKLATGWCSPYQAQEFEAEIDKLPAEERKEFEKEWKRVREHEAWPHLPAGKEENSRSKQE
jgi:hypothetical protein